MLAVPAVMVGLGLFAIVWGLGRRTMQRRELIAAVVEAELGEPTKDPRVLAELMERAGLVAERILGRSTVGGRVRLHLTRAGWSLRPGEFAVVTATAALTAGAVLWMIASFLAGALVVVGVIAASASILARMSRARVTRIEEQLPTVLQLLASSLEAGSSVLHAFEIVVEEGDPPLSAELSRVIAETKVGRPLLESLEAMAARIGSRDLDWTVEAINIQHRTGGKLADTLRVLAEFMRARLEVRGEVRALSAEARLSGKVLTALPLFVGGFFFLFRRSYFDPLLQTSLGRAMLAVGAAGIGVGSWWMRRLVRVEV